MVEQPYVLLSCAMSIDGYIHDASETRLLLSNDADFDRVDAERAGCDAILVGAHTVRQDNPRLLVRSADRRAERTARGLPPSPVKVTLTAHGELDPAVLERISGWGWETGLKPSPQAPVWKMDAFRDRFLTAFGPLSR